MNVVGTGIFPVPYCVPVLFVTTGEITTYRRPVSMGDKVPTFTKT